MSTTATPPMRGRAAELVPHLQAHWIRHGTVPHPPRHAITESAA